MTNRKPRAQPASSATEYAERAYAEALAEIEAEHAFIPSANRREEAAKAGSLDVAALLLSWRRFREAV